MSNSSISLFAGEAAEQFRLVRFQLYNWGTFSGLHDIAISPEGQLFIGGSGSGKSTLLDAMSVLLTPGQINFNAAAREGEKKSDRTVLSYMRGAWTTQQDDEGRAVTQYLRKLSTWSAIALTYKNDFQVVTLMFVAIIRGASNEDARVNRFYYVIPENFDIKRLEPFSEHDYDWRFIRKEIGQGKSFPRFAPYCEYFRKIFGIEEDTVLKLLHKAQSARNLGDLNDFLRKFMLDTPGTFEVADTLVNEFSELYAAHESVVKARDQVAVLTEARRHNDAMLALQQEKRTNEAMIELLDDWRALHMVDLISKEMPRAQKAEKRERDAYEGLQKEGEALETTLNALLREYYEKGGDRIVRLQSDLERDSAALSKAQSARARYEDILSELSLAAPITRDEFQSTGAALSDRIETSTGELSSLREERDQLVASRHDNEVAFKALREEIEAMQKSPSNIPARQLQLREKLAAALEVDVEDLPFAGELLQVKDEEALWQGAIERVLHNFALSILVDDSLYAQFAALVNRLDLHGRLVYHRVQKVSGPKPVVSSRSLVTKLDVKEGRWAPWLLRELAQRFDYACVESVAEFREAERAVTAAGQVKHNKTRHEKDDRYGIDDRTRWVLGFSNEEKLAVYKDKAGALAQAISEHQKKIAGLEKSETRIHSLVRLAQRALDFEWEQIDTGSLAASVLALKNELETLLTNDEILNGIKAREEETRARLRTLSVEKESAYSKWQAAQMRVDELAHELEEYKSQIDNRDIDRSLISRIDQKAAELELGMTLATLTKTRERLFGRLNQAAEKLANQAAEELTALLNVFATFKQRWPDAALQLDARIESAPEFFEKLDNLQREGLPKFEARFKDLLNNQARQNLTDLYQEIDDERNLIKERLREVNKSLARVVFNRTGGVPSYLRIAIADRNLPEVKEFKSIQRSIMGREIDTRDTEAAESYFERINSLVQKLNANSKDPAQLRWRDRVLDVRQHVEFKGVEFEREDEGGERVVEVYQSGAGKSGGQRQKLTVICLAAALRYQLGGKDSDYPRYAPVILDEAFDKADSEFTDIALTIFKDFHFQLIIATPEKSVMTLDPYVGGTTFVSCRNRNTSSVLNIVYDSKTGSFAAKDAPQERGPAPQEALS